MKYNYHTHTTRCFHAKGTDEDYVRAAIKGGFDEIGFADHTPWPFENHVSGMRMHADMLEEYCSSINYLKKKYKHDINIRLGLECEYFPKYMPWLENVIEKNKIDFLILGHHFSRDEPGSDYNGAIRSPEGLYIYKEDILEGMETGFFSYVAHPDLFMRGYPFFDEHCKSISRDIIQKAIETSTPLEYNLLGLSLSMASGKPDYPYAEFWEMAGRMQAPVTIGIDAHIPEAYLDRELFQTGLDNLSSFSLKPVDSVRMLG